MKNNVLDHKKIKRRTIMKFFIAGLLFGTCFPIGAIILESIIKDVPFTLSGLLELHKNNLLLYMIDSAPLFLGLFATLGGISQAKVEVTKEQMVLVIEDMKKTEEENKVLLKKFEREQKINRIIEQKIKETGMVLYDNCKGLSNNMEELDVYDLNIVEYIDTVNGSIREVRVITDELLEQFGTYYGTIDEMFTHTSETNICMSEHLEVAKKLVQMIQKNREVLNDLSVKANEVEAITEFIGNISSQIKLLALNATIESARAGEAGKGFAVVATEIKKLSEKTDEATQRIEGTIQSVTSGIYTIETSMDEMAGEGELLHETSVDVQEKVEGLLTNIDRVQQTSKLSSNQMERQSKALVSMDKQINEVVELFRIRKDKMCKSQETLVINKDRIEMLKDHITE